MSFLSFLCQSLKSKYADYRIRQRFHGKVDVAEDVKIRSPQNLEVGNGICFDIGAYIHCGGAKWCDYKGKVRIGNGTYVGPHCIIFGMGEIEIGENVMIAPHVIISSVQHPYEDTSIPMYKQNRVYKKIIIEDDVYIGSNTVITPGVTISRGSVIGAGAVVTHDIPPYSIAHGVPARVVGKRTHES